MELVGNEEAGCDASGSMNSGSGSDSGSEYGGGSEGGEDEDGYEEDEEAELDERRRVHQVPAPALPARRNSLLCTHDLVTQPARYFATLQAGAASSHNVSICRRSTVTRMAAFYGRFAHRDCLLCSLLQQERGGAGKVRRGAEIIEAMGLAGGRAQYEDEPQEYGESDGEVSETDEALNERAVRLFQKAERAELEAAASAAAAAEGPDEPEGGWDAWQSDSEGQLAAVVRGVAATAPQPPLHAATTCVAGTASTDHVHGRTQHSVTMVCYWTAPSCLHEAGTSKTRGSVCIDIAPYCHCVVTSRAGGGGTNQRCRS